MRNLLLAVTIFHGILAGADDSVRVPEAYAIANVTVIDTNSGAAHPDMTVVVRGNRIASVGKETSLPDNARVIDGRGKFLIPGLWDMHVHLSWTTESALPLLLANGVTSVRDLGSRLEQLDAWRANIASGVMAGPRIFRAGPILNGQSFNAYQLVPGNPDETRGAARALHAAGVDFLKVHRRFPRDSYFALVDEAKKLGLTVVGHIPMTVSPAEASDAGQATIEHTETLFEGTFAAFIRDQPMPDAVRRWRDTPEANALFAKFVANGTPVTPMLVAVHSIVQTLDRTRPPDPRRRYVARSLHAETEKLLAKAKPGALEEWKAMAAELRAVTGQMARAGVTLLAGSDIASSRVPGFTLHDELALLVQSGLTPLQALQSATRAPARVMKKEEDHGAVEAGNVADLVLLDGNPLVDIHNTQRISAVIFDGTYLDRTRLDALLREGERLAGIR